MFLDIIHRLAHFFKKTQRFGDRIQSPKRCGFFKKWTKRWIMSKNIILVIIYHRHKRFDLICLSVFSYSSF
jgi:hypothetical protein